MADDKSGTRSPQPIEQLAPRVEGFDQQLRFLIAISAKVASLLVLSGRYASSIPQEDEDTAADIQDEQKKSDKLQRNTIAEATQWLVLVCGHLDIDLQTLPDNPLEDTSFADQLKADQHFDVAFELVLISLGLAGSGAAEAEKKGTKDGQPETLHYTSSARSLVARTCFVLGIDMTEVEAVEKTIAQALYFQMQKAEANEKDKKKKAGGEGSEWDAGADEVREKEAKSSRNQAFKWAATGAGFVLGGVALGLTGGLAAPAIAPLLAGGLGMTFFAGSGGAILIGTLLGLGGGGLAGYRTHTRLKGLDSLSFEPIRKHDEDTPQIPSLTATISASGFLLDMADSVDPWKSTFEHSGLDAFALKADPETFLQAGKSLDKWVRNKAITMGGTEIIKRTALASLYAGVALPLTVFQGLTTALDSDFAKCRDKAKKAGILLAEILEKKIQGNRPVTLIGYGPGATIVFTCLEELHRRELVRWAAARSVVAHRIVNCYSNHDWLLAINARLHSLAASVAGISAVKAPGIDNVDVSDLLGGHLEIRKVLGEIILRSEGSAKSTSAQGKVEKMSLRD